MILKQEFDHMCNQIGMGDAEISLAEIVWQKAERAMLGKPVQEATLLKKTIYKTPYPDQLTQDELQHLTTALTIVLKQEECYIKKLRSQIDLLWMRSDPDVKDGVSAHCFNEMNNWRTIHRKLKKDHSKLATIQRKLKKQKSK